MGLRSFVFVFFVLLTSIVASSCRKEQLLTSGGNLGFSVDTLLFDTVFTAQASFTKEFKIYNPQGQKINISSIRLEKGDISYFKVNINGYAASSVKDMELAANDSMYVFATVNINPNDDNNPFVVDDRLIVTMNGQEYSVPFIAYGQNAYYFDNEDHLKTQTLPIDKPVVMLGLNFIDSFETLTIPAGCRVYMHGDARIFVYGTLKIMGSQTDTVLMQGDRLDRNYFANRDFAGEWGGIYYFPSSTNNEIQYATIKNCGNGAGGTVPAAIQINRATMQLTDYQLTMKNVRIANSIGYGIIGFGATFKMDNCLVHSCGAQTLALFEGGQFDINNCTFSLYSTTGINGIKHTDNPAVALLNYRELGGESYLMSDVVASSITNSIIYGSLETELFCDKKGSGAYDLKIEDCIYRSKEELPSYIVKSRLQRNVDPLFQDYQNWNYRLKEGSPAINAGTSKPGRNERDLDNKVRNGIDLGCYEY